MLREDVDNWTVGLATSSVRQRRESRIERLKAALYATFLAVVAVWTTFIALPELISDVKQQSPVTRRPFMRAASGSVP
jgi:hypothetical protein